MKWLVKWLNPNSFKIEEMLIMIYSFRLAVHCFLNIKKG